MNSIESQFVPYEIAVKLKELGMQLDAYFGGYTETKEWKWHPDSDIVLDVPIYGQAFDWFRVEHGLESFITPVLDADPSIHQYSFIICSFGMEMDEFSQQLDEGDFNTYESARLSCLEKLIELVTEKKK